MYLLFTFSADFYCIDLVAKHLSDAGKSSIRINMDEYPMQWSISESVSNDRADTVLVVGGERLTTDDLEGVWIRKIMGPSVPDDMPEEYKKGCYNESKMVLTSFLKNVPKEIPVIDRYETVLLAEDKLRQLKLAKSIGITVPNTLITNDPNELNAFFKAANGHPIVMKMMTSLSHSMEGSSFFLRTQRIAESDLADIDMLSVCPLTFQYEVEKDHELRIAYVDGQAFVGALKTKGGETPTDTRFAQDQVQWVLGEFPEKELEKLTKLMQQLELSFGAVDYIVTPAGDYVFLEVNPIGEWGMLEKELDLPISKAIANYLL